MSQRGVTWAPKPEDYWQVFKEQNPWHETGEVPGVWARPVERPLAKLLWRRLITDTPHRFQLILGPRRVGKTTSLYQTVRRLLSEGVPAQRLWWLRLDHPLLMQMPLAMLVRFAISVSKATTQDPVYLFLDELTYADKWDLWLKTFFDENWPVRIAGSSSSTAAIRDRRLESGVGRWEEQYLAPYLFTEFLELTQQGQPIPIANTLGASIEMCIEIGPDVNRLAEQRRRFLLTGGFPELLLNDSGSVTDEASILLESQRTLRNDAVERAIYKDIPQAFGIDNAMMLERVLYTLAGQVAGILSPSNICQTLGGLSQPTFDRYVTYLERAFLVFTVLNYSGSELAKQKRGRKLYFVDGAVRNAALQRGIAPLQDSAEMGLLFENMVAGHLHALSQQSQSRLYYWRDKSAEIDLVYDHPESPVAFEIGSSGSHHRAGLASFIERFPKFRNRCYFVAPGIPAMAPNESNDGIGSLSLDLLLLAVGTQAEHELQARLAPSNSQPNTG